MDEELVEIVLNAVHNAIAIGQRNGFLNPENHALDLAMVNILVTGVYVAWASGRAIPDEIITYVIRSIFLLIFMAIVARIRRFLEGPAGEVPEEVPGEEVLEEEPEEVEHAEETNDTAYGS